MKKYDIHKVIIFTIYFLVSILVLYRGILYEPDSPGFLSIQIGRSPGYVLFATFFKKVFGDNFVYPILISQLAINLVIIDYFRRSLDRIFGFHKIVSYLNLLVLISPLIATYLVANKILTESLAYPLFLLFTNYCISGLVEEEQKKLGYASGVLILLILVRGQFMSMVPIISISSIYVYYRKKTKVFLWFGILFLLIPIITIGIEKTYHYVAFGEFVTIPASHMLASSVFYIADKEDKDIFYSKEEREFFIEVKQKLDENNWTSSYAKEVHYGNIFYWYQSNFPKICNQTLHGTAMKKFENQGYTLQEQYRLSDKLFVKMYTPLLKDNLKTWIKLYTENVRGALGGTRYLLLHFVLLILGIYLVIKMQESSIGKFMVFSTSCVFANLFLLAAVSHSEERYIFYHNWVLFINFFLLINYYLRKKAIK